MHWTAILYSALGSRRNNGLELTGTEQRTNVDHNEVSQIKRWETLRPSDLMRACCFLPSKQRWCLRPPEAWIPQDRSRVNNLSHCIQSHLLPLSQPVVSFTIKIKSRTPNQTHNVLSARFQPAFYKKTAVSILDLHQGWTTHTYFDMRLGHLKILDTVSWTWIKMHCCWFEFLNLFATQQENTLYRQTSIKTVLKLKRTVWE